ncbi:Uncharacterized protein FWK35_00029893 [Aphis craccivora]|uniref:Uncharacterized protein n=1 Tax=Aphis craccivora TaxID=307492 RepID=A0A6G0YSP5_APHCR|nr:Uncharacterized protein FWK35_00029893 [Aphis craccivora]
MKQSGAVYAVADTSKGGPLVSLRGGSVTKFFRQVSPPSSMGSHGYDRNEKNAENTDDDDDAEEAKRRKRIRRKENVKDEDSIRNHKYPELVWTKKPPLIRSSVSFTSSWTWVSIVNSLCFFLCITAGISGRDDKPRRRPSIVECFRAGLAILAVVGGRNVPDRLVLLIISPRAPPPTKPPCHAAYNMLTI